MKLLLLSKFNEKYQFQNLYYNSENFTIKVLENDNYLAINILLSKTNVLIIDSLLFKNTNQLFEFVKESYNKQIHRQIIIIGYYYQIIAELQALEVIVCSYDSILQVFASEEKILKIDEKVFFNKVEKKYQWDDSSKYGVINLSKKKISYTIISNFVNRVSTTLHSDLFYCDFSKSTNHYLFNKKKINLLNLNPLEKMYYNLYQDNFDNCFQFFELTLEMHETLNYIFHMKKVIFIIDDFQQIYELAGKYSFFEQKAIIIETEKIIKNNKVFFKGKFKNYLYFAEKVREMSK